MHKILEEIIVMTKQDLGIRKERIPQELLVTMIYNNKFPVSTFKTAITHPKTGTVAIIGEIKLASPTEPALGSLEDMLDKVDEYEEAGADAISLVTEKHFFKGDISYVKKIKSGSHIPVLMKDFVIDEYQVYEAQLVGADAILLLAAVLEKEDLARLVDVAEEIGIEPVVEVYDEEDIEKIEGLEHHIVGVNARDLEKFSVDVDHACVIMEKIPDRFVKIGFSGIMSSKEVKKYKEAGAHAVLVGTSLMKAKRVKDFISSLRV